MSDGLPLPYEKGTTNNKRNQPTDSNVDDPAEELGAEGEADDVQNYNMKRRRVRFITTPFVGFGKAVRTENPRGPVPTRWKNCPPTHKGIQMIALLKSIFEVIPSTTCIQYIHTVHAYSTYIQYIHTVHTYCAYILYIHICIHTVHTYMHTYVHTYMHTYGKYFCFLIAANLSNYPTLIEPVPYKTSTH